MDIFPVMQRALSAIEPSTVIDRRALYARAREALEAALRGFDPPASDGLIELELRLFQVLVRTIETDIRAKVDIYSTDYAPAGLDEARARLAAKLLPPPSRAGGAAGLPDAELLRAAGRLSSALADHQEHARMLGSMLASLRRVVALLRMNIILHGESSSFALMWMVLRPILTIGIILAIYLYLAMRVVQNMELPAFVAIGILCLAMYQQTAVRSASAFAGRRFLYMLPVVRWPEIMLAEAVFVIGIYSCVLIVLIAGLVLSGLAPPPDETMLFAGLWLSIWMAGLLTGGVLIGLYTYWPFITRLQAVYFRAITLLSGTFFVTEQLPRDLADIVLWNPMIHVVQACRDAYFLGYRSADVDLRYFYMFVTLLALTGTLGGQRARRRLRP